MIKIGKLNQVSNSGSLLDFQWTKSFYLKIFKHLRCYQLSDLLFLIGHEGLKPILILAPLFNKQAQKVYLYLSYLSWFKYLI